MSGHHFSGISVVSMPCADRAQARNVLVSSDFRCKVSDFGHTRKMDESAVRRPAYLLCVCVCVCVVCVVGG
jgi:hypothetical protein